MSDSLTIQMVLDAIEQFPPREDTPAEIRASARSYYALVAEFGERSPCQPFDVWNGVKLEMDHDVPDNYCEVWTVEQVDERRRFDMTAQEYRAMALVRQLGWEDAGMKIPFMRSKERSMS